MPPLYGDWLPRYGEGRHVLSGSRGVSGQRRGMFRRANLGCKTNLIRKHLQDDFDVCYIMTVGTKVSEKELE